MEREYHSELTNTSAVGFDVHAGLQLDAGDREVVVCPLPACLPARLDCGLRSVRMHASKEASCLLASLSAVSAAALSRRRRPTPSFFPFQQCRRTLSLSGSNNNTLRRRRRNILAACLLALSVRVRLLATERANTRLQRRSVRITLQCMYGYELLDT